MVGISESQDHLEPGFDLPRRSKQPLVPQNHRDWFGSKPLHMRVRPRHRFGSRVAFGWVLGLAPPTEPEHRSAAVRAGPAGGDSWQGRHILVREHVSHRLLDADGPGTKAPCHGEGRRHCPKRRRVKEDGCRTKSYSETALYSETSLQKLFRCIQKLRDSETISLYSETIFVVFRNYCTLSYSETISLYSETMFVVFRNYVPRIL